MWSQPTTTPSQSPSKSPSMSPSKEVSAWTYLVYFFWKNRYRPSMKRIFLSWSSNLLTNIIHVITADNNSKPISFEEPEHRAFNVSIKRGKCYLNIILCTERYRTEISKLLFLPLPHQPTTTPSQSPSKSPSKVPSMSPSKEPSISSSKEVSLFSHLWALLCGFSNRGYRVKILAF